MATLDKIASAYHVSRSWLLDGEGKGLELRSPTISTERLEWEQLVEGLDLAPTAFETMLAVPTTMIWLANGFIIPSAVSDDPRIAKREEQCVQELGGALRQLYAGWGQLLRAWIALVGKTNVKRKLESEGAGSFLRRFTPIESVNLFSSISQTQDE
jgi:hypothetical protein